MAVRFAITGETPLHRQLVGRREQLADEVQAAAHRVHGDIWLEKLEIRTRAPVRRQVPAAAAPAADLAALLEDAAKGADLRDRAAEFLAEVKLRMPGTIPADEQAIEADLDVLIAEARDLLLLRTAGPA